MSMKEYDDKPASEHLNAIIGELEAFQNRRKAELSEGIRASINHVKNELMRDIEALESIEAERKNV